MKMPGCTSVSVKPPSFQNESGAYAVAHALATLTVANSTSMRITQKPSLCLKIKRVTPAWSPAVCADAPNGPSTGPYRHPDAGDERMDVEGLIRLYPQIATLRCAVGRGCTNMYARECVDAIPQLSQARFRGTMLQRFDLELQFLCLLQLLKSLPRDLSDLAIAKLCKEEARTPSQQHQCDDRHWGAGDDVPLTRKRLYEIHWATSDPVDSHTVARNPTLKDLAANQCPDQCSAERRDRATDHLPRQTTDPCMPVVPSAARSRPSRTWVICISAALRYRWGSEEAPIRQAGT